MPIDAVRALRDVRDCDGDDLLGFRGQRPVGEDSLAEGIECCFDVGSKGSSFLRNLTGSKRIDGICRSSSCGLVLFAYLAAVD
jgi:hypothetical protein